MVLSNTSSEEFMAYCRLHSFRIKTIKPPLLSVQPAAYPISLLMAGSG
jgi:hypothetical protein